jgi:CheY-like chemotaxis protein
MSMPVDSGLFGTTAPSSPGHIETERVTAGNSVGAGRALLVDDNAEDRLIADRLTADGLETVALAPEGSLEQVRDAILTWEGPQLDAVLLDYRLDDRANHSGDHFAHRAGPLAAALREVRPDLPLILVTTEANQSDWVGASRLLSPFFDLVLLKSELNDSESRKSRVAGILDLAEGYRQLKQVAGSGPVPWTTVGLALGMSEQEAETFSREWPDPEPSGLADLVAVILRGLLAPRPGPLLTHAEAAARLSITPGALRPVLVQFAELAYQGPFARLHPRVWRGRLDRISVDAAGELDAVVSQLQGQLCRVCDERKTTRACSLCELGVDDRHFVTTQEMMVPAWSEARAVCFSCIEDGTADDCRFGGSSKTLVDRIRALGWREL